MRPAVVRSCKVPLVYRVRKIQLNLLNLGCQSSAVDSYRTTYHVNAANQQKKTLEIYRQIYQVLVVALTIE
jgi:hypothetical protein